MTIEILASGSSGNVTAVKPGESLFLIDCGKTFRWTIERLNNRLPDALLITHEHSDHAKAAKNFLTRGVEVYMTAGTANALNLGERHNLHTIAEGKTFTAAGVEVTPIESFHDAAEPVNFILQDADDRVLFVTDTGNVPNVEGDFNKILIEANYSMPLLMGSDAFYNLKNRIMESHLSFEAAQKFLQGYPNAEVTLLHVSKRHGDEEDFYRRLRSVNNGYRSQIGECYGGLPQYAARRL